jgi:hypothetical protein
MDSEYGTLDIRSQENGKVLLDFSSEKAFRFFLRSLQKLHISAIQLNKMVSQVESLPYPITVRVDGNDYLSHVPGQRIQMNRWKFARLVLLNWLGG